MNILSSKLTAFAAALALNGLIMSAVGYLFALQSQPELVSDCVRNKESSRISGSASLAAQPQ